MKKKSLPVFFVGLLMCGCQMKEVINEYNVVPLPVTMSEQQGRFYLNSDVPIVVNASQEVKHIASGLSTTLLDIAGLKLKPTDELHENVPSIVFDSIPGMEKEAYKLSVTPQLIKITASAPNGFYYGLQTLYQLLPVDVYCKERARNAEWSVPCVEIEDAPTFRYRGAMLDVCRHFASIDYIKKFIDVLAAHKMNTFHWHLTDDQGWRIEIKKYPKLTKIGAVGNWHDAQATPQFYTQDDIREIVAYAAERQIMVVPEFDMPGHATAVCRAYPEVSGGGEGRWKHFTFHPCKEETYRFISDVLDEIVALFPAPYIHIGGDEVHYGNQNWFTDPEIQNFIKEKGLINETGLEHYFIRRAADLVAAKGKKMIGWDEIVDAGISPSKALVMWWRHDRKYQLLKALEQGYQVVLTPRRPLYGDFVQDASHKVGRYWDGFNPLQDIYAFPEPISHLFKGYEDQILGMQFTLWTERIADGKRLDFMTFPRLIALAESAWTSSKEKDWSRFCMRLPSFLEYLKEQGIYYFDVIHPQETPEPGGPEKADVLQNG